ncbi:T9SS type A sorting domain-containing protein [Aequorivita sp. SDUM287046]|uniref:T9SS type A sorting domain-containing protein n=1 Tax=Aequorivita aurantiaca TaxID=3053356 RepID=A0ABT8DIH1_9FLAO|nr:T9SS type A sorting domain-containing protein [Aequorivita aurantiaca]MDN3725133.1 T9SS type A sorting domain-containing protein [Aequorivita aurantiaca]
MKNLFTLFLILPLCFIDSTPLYAQLDFVGSEDYGRISNITYDPIVENRLFATSMNNHILQSEDNGETWEVLFSMPYQYANEFQNLRMTNNNMALSFVKYNRDSPDNSILIFDLNTNSIIKEIEIPHNASVKTIQSYAISTQNSDIILMNTVLDFGIEEITYYTVNGGQNWVSIYSKNDHDGVSLNNIAINPQNSQHLVLTRGFGPNGVEGGLLFSTDAGQTWNWRLENIILNPIAFNPFNTDEMYVATGINFGNNPENLYRSDDGGDTWNVIPLPWTEGNLNNINLISYNPITEGHIIVLEENEIVVSNDNGTSWEHYVYDPVNVHLYYSGWNLSFNPFNEEEVFINSDYFPLFSQDGGATISWKKNKYFRSTGSIGIFADNDVHLYYGVQYGYVHRNLTTQIEETFDLVPLDAYNQGDAPALFIDTTTEGRIFTFSSGWFGADLQVSNDHGQNKFQMHNTYMNYVDVLKVNPHNHNEVWYSLSNTMGEIEFWKADISDLNNISNSPITPPEAGLIKGLHFYENEVDKAIISIGTDIYKTNDSGLSWEISNTGLEELLPGTDLIIHLSSNPLNEHQLTLSTNKGIFTTLNAGESWSKIYEGIVHKTFHSEYSEAHVIGIVFDSDVSQFKIIYSEDGGQIWNTIENEQLLQITAVDANVKFEEESAAIYIGSIDLGLMKYTIDLSTLGLEEINTLEESIIFYPNPVNHSIHLKSKYLLETIGVYNMNGQKLLFKNINAFQTDIDLSFLNKGVFILQVEDTKGNQTIKIIKE